MSILLLIQRYNCRVLKQTVSAYEAEQNAYVDTNVYLLSKALPAGEALTKDDLTSCTVKLPRSQSILYASDSKNLICQYAKTALKKGQLLTADFFYSDERLTERNRYLELSDIRLPESVHTNNLIDIRISFPTGEDYIVLNQQRVLSLLNEDEKVFITGRANVEEDKNGKIICEQITSFDSVKRELWLQFSTKEEFEAKEQELYGKLHDSDGRDSVVIYISSIKAMKRLPNNYNICINQEIVNNLTNFLGENNVKVVEKSIEKRA